MAVASTSIRKEIYYDYRHGYFGHCLVNLSWDNPLGNFIVSLLTLLPIDMVSISRFEIHLEHAQFLNHCRKAVYEVLPHFNEVSVVLEGVWSILSPCMHAGTNKLSY